VGFQARPIVCFVVLHVCFGKLLMASVGTVGYGDCFSVTPALRRAFGVLETCSGSPLYFVGLLWHYLHFWDCVRVTPALRRAFSLSWRLALAVPCACWSAVAQSSLPRSFQGESCATEGFQCLGDLPWQSLEHFGLLWHYLVFWRAAMPGIYLRLARMWLIFRPSLLRFFLGSPLNWCAIGTRGRWCFGREAVEDVVGGGGYGQEGTADLLPRTHVSRRSVPARRAKPARDGGGLLRAGNVSAARHEGWRCSQGISPSVSLDRTSC
jgi:hypothetical protein